MSDSNRFVVVGGNPFTGYNGAQMFTGLKVVARASSKELAQDIVRENYEQCGGLLLIIDCENETSSNEDFFG